jgi:hypothetical protein
MAYRIHKVGAKIAGGACLAVVTMQCTGNAIRDWQFSPILSLVWGSIPAMLMWFFFRFKKPQRCRTAPDNPYWAATGDDHTKLLIIGIVMLMLEFVFKH